MLFIRNGPIMIEMIKSMWYYLSQSLEPLLWINLLALRDKDKDMDARTWNPNTADAMMLREDE
jgi:hypothetical protein